GLFRNLSANSVCQANLSIDSRWVGSAFRSCMYFHAGERFSFFVQDVDNIGSGASAQPDENKFHGAVGDFLLASIEYNGMTTGGNAGELVGSNPSADSLNHKEYFRGTKYDLRFFLKTSFHRELRCAENSKKLPRLNRYFCEH